MDIRESRAAGWQTFSGLVLALGGIFAVVHGLTAVYRSTFFVNDAVFVFSGLETWGWITLGIGILAFVSGLAVFSGREWARWMGIGIAALGALGQLLIVQAYPLWSLMIMSIYVLAVYGLAVYGVGESAASAAGSSRSESTTADSSQRVSGVSETGDRESIERERRAA